MCCDKSWAKIKTTQTQGIEYNDFTEINTSVIIHIEYGNTLDTVWLSATIHVMLSNPAHEIK